MAKYKFECQNGHTYYLSISGCRCCPGLNCDAIGTSKIVPGIIDRFLSFIKRFLYFL